MIAFRHPLPPTGQRQLRGVLGRRFSRLARKLPEMQGLALADREVVLAGNVPLMVELQICSLFNPDLYWRDQLVPILGQEEVTTH